MGFKYASMAERIVANSVLSDDGKGCWWWTGKRGSNDYPLINIRENGRHRTLLAHRLSFITFRGAIADGLEVDHDCVCHWCVNPWHLTPRTPQENCRLRNLRRFNAYTLQAEPETII